MKVQKIEDIIVGFDLDTLNNSKDIIYALSKTLKLIYFNEAWIRFAKENGADVEFMKKYNINTSIKNAIPVIFRKYYLEKFKESLSTGKIWRFDYECSSADTFRTFNQITYPLKNGKGLVVVNRIRVEMPMSKTKRISKKALEQYYLHKTGFINQCCNCRCVQSVDNPEVWDWVPDWVKDIHPKTSHTICPVCYDYYWKYYKIKFTPS